MFPRSTHETFAQKLYQTFQNHKRFSKPKLARSDFTICHYAGDVSLFIYCNKCRAWIFSFVLKPWIIILLLFYYRSHIKQNCFWIKTKTTLLLSTRHSWGLQSVLLYLVCFQNQRKNPQTSQSSLLLALASRHVAFSNEFCSSFHDATIESKLNHHIFFYILCSNNCSHCLKLWMQLNPIIFDVWSQIIC